MVRIGFLALSIAMTATVAGAAEVSSAIDVTTSIGGIRNVVIDIPVGEVRVKSGSGSDVRIMGKASREVSKSKREAKAQSIVDATSVEVLRSASIATIRPKYGPAARGWFVDDDTKLDLEIVIPAGSNLELKQKTGEVIVDGSFGNVDIKLGVGEITLRLPKSNVGELEAHTKVGEVRADLGTKVVTKEGILPGRTHFINDGGRSKVTARTRIGEIDIVLTEK